MNNDLESLINNLGEDAVDIITAIAMKMSVACAEKWTGKIEFTLNTIQGSFGDCPISQTEVFKPRKKRRVRR